MKEEMSEYVSLLRCDDRGILLEGHDLVKYANMDTRSASVFASLVERLLLVSDVKDYQVIKNVVKSYDSVNAKISCNSRSMFELKVKPNVYDEVREIIFEFAYSCCSKRVEEVDSGYWLARGYDFEYALDVSRFTWQKGEFSAIFPSNFKGYDVKPSFIKIDEEDYQKQYQQFLLMTTNKDKVKKLVKK